MTRVLVHEPDPELRELFGCMLESLGFEAVSGGDAVAALVEPGDLAGRLVLHTLRLSRPELPVVCVSVYPLDDEVAALSPAVYLMKPISTAGLREALAAALAPVG
jgi:CheY-like chemotaxis protein